MPPLHSFTKVGQIFEYMKNHDDTFHMPKKKIRKAPVLILPNLQRSFKLEVDALKYAMEAIWYKMANPNISLYDIPRILKELSNL